MAQKLTPQAQGLLDQTTKYLNMILEIEGIYYLFSTGEVETYWRIGDEGVFIGDDIEIGGTIVSPRSKACIDVDSSTKVISQQLDFENGGASSIQTMNICLIDNGGEISRVFAEENNPEKSILGRKAKIHFSLAGGSYPEDAFKIFQGIVSEVQSGTGRINILISHAQKLEDRALFVKKTATLTQAMTSASGVAYVDRSDVFIPVPLEINQELYSLGCELIPYVKIGDEIMEASAPIVEESEGVFYIPVVRGKFRTIPEAHEIDDDIEILYKLKGDAVNLALLLLMSTPDGEDRKFTEIKPSSINIIPPAGRVPNAVFFFGIDLAREYGIVEGDWCEVFDSEIEENNNGGTRKVKDIVVNDFGSYVVVDGPILIDEGESPVKFKFMSQFNILPDGCGLSGAEVDVAEFIYLKKLLGSSIQNYEFTIDDEINAKEFINTQILRPSGLLQIPRKGMISCGATIPPIAGDGTIVLSAENAKLNGLKNLNITRSINRNYYNTVMWQFNFDEVSGDPKQTEIYVNQESYARMNVGKKTLKIEALGLRKSANTLSNIESQSRRYLDRYKGAAGEIKLSFNLKAGLNIDIGDSVIFDGRDFQLTDTDTGERDFTPRLMQVVNKELAMSGSVTLSLVNANFSTGARYGVIAPSSGIVSGDIDRLKLKGLFVDSPDSEKKKWAAYIGERVVVRNEDWSKFYYTKIVDFDESDPKTCYIDPIPDFTSDLIYLDCPPYDESDYRKDALMKQLHCFLTPQVVITEGISNKSFKVDLSDIERFKTDTYVNIHNDDFSHDFETQVESVVGSIITLKKTMPFIPDVDYKIDLIGFLDGGMPYRIL